MEKNNAKVVLAAKSVTPQKSKINNQSVVTYWDNITVHDQAFHRHQYELLKEIGILRNGFGKNYQDSMHIEAYSDWAPVDTDSGSTKDTAKLFDCHIVHKMKIGELLIVNNRTWCLSVNNWEPGEQRQLLALYA